MITEPFTGVGTARMAWAADLVSATVISVGARGEAKMHWTGQRRRFWVAGFEQIGRGAGAGAGAYCFCGCGAYIGHGAGGDQ